MDIRVFGNNILIWRDRAIHCALGRAGVRKIKKEGDGVTPVGDFSLRRVLYRPDRLDAPKTDLPVSPLTPKCGWCDDPDHMLYNLPVTLPFNASHEVLWRDDHLYDLIVVMGHNDDPPVPKAGSAIFFHVATEDFQPTEGCVAVATPDLLAILSECDPSDRLSISADTYVAA
jgi:L,D-peptidoglycan transpeptidase YkuD (ErfK/YbiS/YcfS/YnhG family)